MFSLKKKRRRKIDTGIIVGLRKEVKMIEDYSIEFA